MCAKSSVKSRRKPKFDALWIEVGDELNRVEMPSAIVNRPNFAAPESF